MDIRIVSEDKEFYREGAVLYTIYNGDMSYSKLFDKDSIMSLDEMVAEANIAFEKIAKKGN